jgi:UDP-glucose:(heptosyl)LPS alpha-1,3-glucosyltransferase
VPDKLRIAVVSPFLDRRHGTERCVFEQVVRLARDRNWEVHVYAQRIEDLETMRFPAGGTRQPQAGAIFWHRVWAIRGPHLLRFLWWFVANRFARWRDKRSDGLHIDLVYSPGINCWDSDAICVHACFSALEERSRNAPSARSTGFLSLVRRLHRRLYYSLVAYLEKRLYARRSTVLATVSRRTARELERRFGRTDVRVIPNAVDSAVFHPAARLTRRPEARPRFGYVNDDFVVLLIGNDWRMKGLSVLLEAAAGCRELPLRLLVAGEDDPNGFVRRASQLGIGERVRFAVPSDDVILFYAAADAYVAPSLEDSFNLPVLEAMACGLPVAVSIRAGVSEWIEDGVSGVLLQTPEDPSELSAALRRLIQDPARRTQLGERAAGTAKTLSWERNVSELSTWLESCARAKENAQ